MSSEFDNDSDFLNTLNNMEYAYLDCPPLENNAILHSTLNDSSSSIGNFVPQNLSRIDSHINMIFDNSPYGELSDGEIAELGEPKTKKSKIEKYILSSVSKTQRKFPMFHVEGTRLE